MHGADETLSFAVVADRPAGRLDAARQGCVGDDAPTPDFGDQLVFGDQAAGVAQQKRKQFKDLGLNRADLAVAPQLESRDVQLAVGKAHRR